MDSNSEDTSSPDTSLSNDLGHKLKEQVTLTTELDSHLSRHLTKHLAKKTEDTPNPPQLPENIKRIGEMIEAGECNFLNLAELLEYRAFLCEGGETLGEDCGLVKLKMHAVESEKNKLIEEIYALKKLLSNVSCEVVKSLEGESALEWRRTILNEIAATFQKENEMHVAELRRFVVSGSGGGGVGEGEKIAFLEGRICSLAGLHEMALKKIEEGLRQDGENEVKRGFESEIARLVENEKLLKKESKWNLEKSVSMFFVFY